MTELAIAPTPSIDEVASEIPTSVPADRTLAEATPVELIERQGFRIGSLNLLCRFEAASELAEMPTLYRLPGTPSDILGLANLHGAVVPVFELSTRFHLQRETKTRAMLLVIGHGDLAAGLVIDGLPLRKKFLGGEEINIVDILNAASAPELIKMVAVSGYKQDDTVWIELDFEQLFERIAQSQ